MITYLFVKAPGLKVYYQLYMKGSLFFQYNCRDRMTPATCTCKSERSLATLNEAFVKLTEETFCDYSQIMSILGH